MSGILIEEIVLWHKVIRKTLNNFFSGGYTQEDILALPIFEMRNYNSPLTDLAI